MTPWYPLADQVVEPVVHLGAVGMGSPSTPLRHIGFLGLGSWALHVKVKAVGVGSLVALGRQPRPCTREGKGSSPLPSLGRAARY